MATLNLVTATDRPGEPPAEVTPPGHPPAEHPGGAAAADEQFAAAEAELAAFVAASEMAQLTATDERLMAAIAAECDADARRQLSVPPAAGVSPESP